MSVQVKICGLSTADTLDAAVQGGADLVGFVFYEPSPRNIDLETAHALARLVPGHIRKVALVVDADNAKLDGIVEALDPDFIQTHGSETPERIAEIKQRYGRAIIKAIKVSKREDLDEMTLYENIADLILFDAKAPATLENALPGGNGLAFDWQLIANRKPSFDFILSGGLEPDNVAEALDVTGADIVDVSSGVETSPGNKDKQLIADFILAAKKA